MTSVLRIKFEFIVTVTGRVVLGLLLIGADSVLAQENAPPGVITTRKYLHSCPAGTEQVGDGPPKSTVVFCRQFISSGPRLTGDYTSFYYNGNKKVSGEYIAGKKEGTWTYYTRDGRVRDTRTYENGVRKREPKAERNRSSRAKKDKIPHYSQNEQVLDQLREARSGARRKRRINHSLGWPGS